jgi:hypothetical protein
VFFYLTSPLMGDPIVPIVHRRDAKEAAYGESKTAMAFKS